MKNIKMKLVLAALAALALTAAFFAGGGDPGPGPPSPGISSGQPAPEGRTSPWRADYDSPIRIGGERQAAGQTAPTPAPAATPGVTISPGRIVQPAEDLSGAETRMRENQAPPFASPAPSARPPQQDGPSCTLSVNCATILDNLDKLTKGKKVLVPEGGSVFYADDLSFQEGESAFDLLLREMKDNGIHLDYSMSIVFNTAYIKGIANLYESDCGDLSGWKYKVNEEYLSYGCSLYTLQDGDLVEFVYTCDNGADVGGYLP